MEPVMQPTAIVAFDWYCERLHCKMTKSACERRRVRAVTGRYENRLPYSDAGCDKCTQVKNKKGTKMVDLSNFYTIPRADKETNSKMDKKEKRCKGECCLMRPLDDFHLDKSQADGLCRICKPCKSMIAKAKWAKTKEKIQPIQEAPKTDKALSLPRPSKTSEEMAIDIELGIDTRRPGHVTADELVAGYSAGTGIDTRPMPAGLRPIPGLFPSLPKSIPEGYTRTIEQLVDFTAYPDIFQAVQAAAETEFRPVGMQILYMLEQQIKDRYPNQIEG